jgi:hypothetical protein
MSHTPQGEAIEGNAGSPWIPPLREDDALMVIKVN